MKGFPRKVVGAKTLPTGLSMEGLNNDGTVLKLECKHEVFHSKGPRTLQCVQCKFDNSMKGAR